MAVGIMYRCDHCNYAIEAWSDGNPYYIDKKGLKQYAYHPDAKRGRCIGNDVPHICLSCGDEFNVDTREPISECPKCCSSNIADCFKLDRLHCPKCKNGLFRLDNNFQCIS